MKEFGLHYLGSLASILVSSSFTPQIIKGYKTKRLDDVSYLLMILISIEMELWIVYGIEKQDPMNSRSKRLNRNFEHGVTELKIKIRKNQNQPSLVAVFSFLVNEATAFSIFGAGVFSINLIKALPTIAASAPFFM